MKIVILWPWETNECTTWWGSVLSRAAWQWRTVFRSWLPLYISFWSEARRKRGNGCLIADWIWFWRNTITSGSNLPGAGLCTTCGFSQNDSCTHNWGCRQTSQWELPTWKHEGPNRQLVLHHMSVMGCLNSNSVDLLATKAYWKGLLLWLQHEISSSFPLLLCTFLSSPWCFWLVQVCKIYCLLYFNLLYCLWSTFFLPFIVLSLYFCNFSGGVRHPRAGFRLPT